MLRVSIRPFTALPVMIAYRGHFREISPGQSYEIRLIEPRGERTSCAPTQLDTGTKG
jgi:hypothetical protein